MMNPLHRQRSPSCHSTFYVRQRDVAAVIALLRRDLMLLCSSCEYNGFFSSAEDLRKSLSSLSMLCNDP